MIRWWIVCNLLFGLCRFVYRWVVSRLMFIFFWLFVLSWLCCLVWFGWKFCWLIWSRWIVDIVWWLIFVVSMCVVSGGLLWWRLVSSVVCLIVLDGFLKIWIVDLVGWKVIIVSVCIVWRLCCFSCRKMRKLRFRIWWFDRIWSYCLV